MHKIGKVIVTVFVGFNLLLTFYYISYRFILDPSRTGITAVATPYGSFEDVRLVPGYYLTGKAWKHFFAPANSIDRLLRPDAWDPDMHVPVAPELDESDVREVMDRIDRADLDPDT